MDPDNDFMKRGRMYTPKFINPCNGARAAKANQNQITALVKQAFPPRLQTAMQFGSARPRGKRQDMQHTEKMLAFPTPCFFPNCDANDWRHYSVFERGGKLQGLPMSNTQSLK